MDFEFPKGVRFSAEDELPNDERKAALLQRIREATIQSGYIVKGVDTSGYSHYVEANVSAPVLWGVFSDLCRSLMPVTSAPILGIKEQSGHDLYFGPYTHTELILAAMGEFKFQLANDGYIQFGLIMQYHGHTDEVFVCPAKDLKVWTNNLLDFRSVMQSYHIPEAEKLSFLDEFPRTTIAEYPGCIIRHEEVIRELTDQFNALPPA